MNEKTKLKIGLYISIFFCIISFLLIIVIANNDQIKWGLIGIICGMSMYWCYILNDAIKKVIK